MNVEYSVRQQHARAVLDSLHPMHCGDLPEPLLQRARHSQVGRRHLAKTALRRAPGVFAPDHERWQPWQRDEPWLQWPQVRLQAFTRKLGVIALGPALRMIVERSAVLFIRSALGTENWRHAQSVNVWPESAPEAIRNMGEAVLQRCDRDAHALSAAVDERGKIEFIGHAERRHESLAARLALAYATVPADSCRGDCWLPASAVPMLLAEQSVLDAEVSAMPKEGPSE